MLIERSSGRSRTCPQARACDMMTNIFGNNAFPNPFY